MPHALYCSNTDNATLLTLLQTSDAHIAATLILQHLQHCGLPAQAVVWENAQATLEHVPPSLPDSRYLPAVVDALRGNDPAPQVYLLPAGAELPRQAVVVAAGDAPWQALPADVQWWLDIAGRRLHEVLDSQQQQAAIAQLEQSELLQQALFAIADLAGSVQDMDSMLRGLHEIIAALMYARNFFIALFDAQRHSVRFIYFVDEKDGQLYHPDEELSMQSMRNTLTLAIIEQGIAVRGPSTEVARTLGLPSHQTQGTPSVDFLGVPMRRDGQVQGVLVVQSYQRGVGYTERDSAVLGFVAEHVLNALERRQQHEALEQRVRERTHALAQANAQLQEQIAQRERAAHLQATLYHIAALANEGLDNEAFYQRLHHAIGELLNAENFYIALVSSDGQTLEFPYTVDTAGEAAHTRPMGHGVSEYLMRQGHTLLLSAADLQRLVAQGEVSIPTASGTTASVCWLGAPLLGPQGVLGLVAVQSYRADLVYTREDADVLTFVSHQIATTLQRHRQALALQRLNAELEDRVRERTRALEHEIAIRKDIQTQLQHQVMHDPLTSLPNRVLLREHLQRALHAYRRDAAKVFGLLYMDIDRFKLFNDNLGHPCGDAVLCELARRLQACVRSPDTVARLSGDEFAVLVDMQSHPQAAIRVAQRIQDAMRTPMRIAERELQVSVSIGIAISTDKYTDIDEILHDADVALYRAKTAGRQRFVLFDEAQNDAALNVLDVEQQLHKALQQQELVPFFQPIVRLDDGQTVGYEALVRWQHPERGLLGPGEFLPIAEETGLIEAIDWQLYRSACLAALPWLQAGQFLTINVSPRHFHNADLATSLLALLEDTGLAPAQLHIEVTENTLLGNPAQVAQTLQQLQDAGVHAALDDFGTGYSSLGYVHRFPLAMLKIDRSFVQELDKSERPRSAAIIEAVLGLGRALDLSVVAEGIETASQRDSLQAMGCTLGQGFFFGRPAPARHWREQVAAATKLHTI